MLKHFYRKGDFIIVLHIADNKKSYLTPDFRPEAIRNFFKIELLTEVAKQHYSIIVEERDVNPKTHKQKSIKDCIITRALQQNATYIFMGYHGRKGPKKESTIMGSKVKSMGYNIKSPTFVSKYFYMRNAKEGKGFQFAVCLDGSEQAFKTLDVLADIINPELDMVIAVTVLETGITSPAHSPVVKKCEERHKEFMTSGMFSAMPEKNRKISEKYYAVQNKKEGRSIMQCLVDFVNINEEHDNLHIDFCLFGNAGLGAEQQGLRHIGRTAAHLITNLKCNPIFVPQDL